MNSGEQVWKDILTRKFGSYVDGVAVSQITITKPSILKRFKIMNNNKPADNQIKPFNFILIGSEISDVIPCLPYTKNISTVKYEDFIDYRSGKASGELPLPTEAYWKSLEDVLAQYVRHNDNKFVYIDGLAHRKHIVVGHVRYKGKESNNLEESMILGIDDDSYIEYENLKEFYEWVLKLKHKDVRDKGI
ncbi:MAG: hypothetical protein QW046_03570 [Candidatus Micrarchaeaceae archaeon]